MIAIVNVDSNPRKTGIHLYEVRINTKVICQFTHKRENSLDILLKLAAVAVEEQQKKKESKL
jgi:hypothetical protein